MLLTYGVYLFCAILILWGGKFAGFGDRFHEDFCGKESTKSVCGLASILIIFHHISQEGPFCSLTHELGHFYDIGFMLVAVFFFCSGYGLTLSADRDPDYIRRFPRRRLHTVIIPFYVNTFLCGLNYLYLRAPLPRIVLGVLGLIQLNPYGWFPFVLFTMYIVFYFSRRCLKSRRAQLLSYLIATLAIIAIFAVTGHFAWWAGESGWWMQTGAFKNAPWWMQQKTFWFNGEWWTNSSVGFVLGAAFAAYREPIIRWVKRRYWLKTAASVLLFVGFLLLFHAVRDQGGYWTEFTTGKPEVGDKLLCALAQLPVTVFFVISLFLIMMKFRTENPVTRFMGKITYETYLIGLTMLESFQFLEYRSDGAGGWIMLAWKPANWNLIVYTVLVLVTTVAAGWLLHQLDTWILNRLDRVGMKKQKLSGK